MTEAKKVNPLINLAAGGISGAVSKTITAPLEKVKLAILKYYKVDEHGKITRLRRECTSETCGAGVFMAAHFDRQVRLHSPRRYHPSPIHHPTGG